MVQKEWDMGRVDRSAERLDAQLQQHEISAMQRAVIWFLVAFDDPMKSAEDIDHDKDMRTRTVRTTYHNAAAWCLAFAPPAAGLKVDRSSICRAVQAWVDRGVVFRQTGRTRTRLVLSVDRLRKWFESLGDPFEPALFSALPAVVERCDVLLGVAACCEVLSPVVERCEVLSSVAPELNLNERMNDHSIIQNPEPQTRHSTQTSQMGRWLSTLPELPEDVWTARSESSVLATIKAWWEKHGLADRFGQKSESVGATLLGLIEAARRAKDPAAFFWKSRATPATYLEANGRKWIKRSSAANPPVDPSVANLQAKLRARRDDRDVHSCKPLKGNQDAIHSLAEVEV